MYTDAVYIEIRKLPTKKWEFFSALDFKGFRCPCQVVDATGFEPATSASRTQRSTKLSHASKYLLSHIISNMLNYNTTYFLFCPVQHFYFFLFFLLLLRGPFTRTIKSDIRRKQPHSRFLCRMAVCLTPKYLLISVRFPAMGTDTVQSPGSLPSPLSF